MPWAITSCSDVKFSWSTTIYDAAAYSDALHRTVGLFCPPRRTQSALSEKHIRTYTKAGVDWLASSGSGVVWPSQGIQYFSFLNGRFEVEPPTSEILFGTSPLLRLGSGTHRSSRGRRHSLVPGHTVKFSQKESFAKSQRRCGNLLSLNQLVVLAQALALALALWTRRFLGLRRFQLTAEPTDGHLVTTGPYGIIRQQIYPATSLFILPGALAHHSLLAFTLATVVKAGALTRMP